MRFDLNDEDWALLEPLLPKSRKSARVDDRKIIHAIFYVLHCPPLPPVVKAKNCFSMLKLS